jgi:hypothetical protein
MSLGFVVRDGSRGGHKLFTHPKLSDFLGAAFNCGHSTGDVVKPAYVRDIQKIVEKYRDELAVLYGD